MIVESRLIQNSEHAAIVELVQFVEEFTRLGYRLPKEVEASEWWPRKYGPGFYAITMVKEDVVELVGNIAEATVETPLEDVQLSVEALVNIAEESREELKKVQLEALQELEKKAELLSFASSVGIEIPTSVKLPAQIKKFLLIALEGAPEEMKLDEVYKAALEIYNSRA